jgi:CHASE3 domain sensor protein
MKKSLSSNLIIVVIGISFLGSTVFSVRNNYTIQQNRLLQQQADLVKQRTQEILSKTMHGLDLGVRGYGLTLDEKLLVPYKEAITITPSIFYQLDSMLALQKYKDRDKLELVKAEINSYIDFSNQMIATARNNNLAAFTEMLKEDRGYNVWAKYNEFVVPLFAFEDALNNSSVQQYELAMKTNLFLQLAIFFFGMPILYLFVSRVKKERSQREKLMQEVARTDKTFVFDSGANEANTVEDINAQSIKNVQEASAFVQHITQGNYDIGWSHMSDDLLTLNEKTLAGNLIHLRDRLKLVKKQDEERHWSNEGVAKFSEIVRTNQNSPELAVKCISFLTKYLAAQQGSLFLVESEGDSEYLNLAGCYAFDRRKFIEKKIDIGSGLVGQAYLEGEPVMLKQLPKGYTHITSGLGEATPTSLCIVPMKSEGKVIAVVEFAAFYQLEDYKIQFLVKAGEFFASAIVNTRTTIKMKELLEQGTQREEEMRQREEELRQNMEELQATQEELVRKQKDIDRFSIAS